MGIDRRDDTDKKRDYELIEEEYDKREDTLDKPRKRLRVKERESKKSDAVLKKGRALEAFTNNHFRVRVGNEEVLCPLSGRLKIVDFGQRSMVVVGDYVMVDVSQQPRKEEISDRKNSLVRYIERGRKQLRVVIAAIIDQVMITASCSEPPLNLNLVDRYICAARISEIEPIVCINKTDQTDNLEQIKEQCSFYEQLGIKVNYVSAETGAGIEQLKERLANKDTVFSGVSGAGKSSLINRLDPEVKLKTAEVSQSTSKGRYTTSGSRLIPWAFGGYLTDTPGVKTFGLNRNDRERIPRIFPGFPDWVPECRFSNCSHISEEGCRVISAVERGELPEERYQSYLNILSSLD